MYSANKINRRWIGNYMLRKNPHNLIRFCFSKNAVNSLSLAVFLYAYLRNHIRPNSLVLFKYNDEIDRILLFLLFSNEKTIVLDKE